jgi:hypothetical protein
MAVDVHASETQVFEGRGAKRLQDAARCSGRIRGSASNLVEQPLELGMCHRAIGYVEIGRNRPDFVDFDDRDNIINVRVCRRYS